MTAYAFPCAVKPELFDTGKGREVRVVRKALRICDTCPAMLACRTAGREGREWGIWGGETQSERWGALGITEEDLLPPDCETEMAYRRHKDADEECDPCRLAHNARQQAYKEAADERKRKEKAEADAKKAEEQKQYDEIPGSRVSAFHSPLRSICGTERGYRYHLRKAELQLAPHPECTCREAHRVERATKRAVQKEAQAAA